MTARKVTPTAAAELAAQMTEYQRVMDEKIAQYDALVADAQSQLDAIVKAANPEPIVKPEAQWTEANGNKLLVLNESAAEFFQAIFEQVGVLATELGKATKK